jgi:soluble cytochrome b562
MERIKPATYVLEPGEYKDKLPECHVVELRCQLADRAPYEKMKRDFVVQFPTAEILAANAAAVTSKLQQMASGFVYASQRVASDVPGKFTSSKEAVWFSRHKFDRLDELLEENQHANTLLVYQFQEEVAELRRRYPKLATLDDDRAIERWNAGQIELLAVHPKSAGHGLNLQHGGVTWSFCRCRGRWNYTNKLSDGSIVPVRCAMSGSMSSDWPRKRSMKKSSQPCTTNERSQT